MILYLLFGGYSGCCILPHIERGCREDIEKMEEPQLVMVVLVVYSQYWLKIYCRLAHNLHSSMLPLVPLGLSEVGENFVVGYPCRTEKFCVGVLIKSSGV